MSQTNASSHFVHRVLRNIYTGGVIFFFFPNFVSIKFGDGEEDSLRNVDLWSEVPRMIVAEEFFTSFGREAFQTLCKTDVFFTRNYKAEKRKN